MTAPTPAALREIRHRRLRRRRRRRALGCRAAATGSARARHTSHRRRRGGLTRTRGRGAGLRGNGIAGQCRATCRLEPVIVRLDRVTREGDARGDYVQWDPMELAYTATGTSSTSLTGPTSRPSSPLTSRGRPTATTAASSIAPRKGWRYGIEGRGSHRPAATLCAPSSRRFLFRRRARAIPRCDGGRLWRDSREPAIVERCLER